MVWLGLALLGLFYYGLAWLGLAWLGVLVFLYLTGWLARIAVWCRLTNERRKLIGCFSLQRRKLLCLKQSLQCFPIKCMSWKYHSSRLLSGPFSWLWEYRFLQNGNLEWLKEEIIISRLSHSVKYVNIIYIMLVALLKQYLTSSHHLCVCPCCQVAL